MKNIFMIFVCLMVMFVSANAHNTHYPTYTEDGITYVKTGGRISISGKGAFDTWYVQKVDKPYDKTITIPYEMIINGEEVRVTSIMENAFSDCVSLDSLIISDMVRIQDNTFVGCKYLNYLYFSSWNTPNKHCTYKGLYCKTLETKHGVREDNFWKQISNSLEKLIITDEGTFYNRMDYCKNLKIIVCYATNTPETRASDKDVDYMTCSGIVKFEPYQWSTITLYVPRESLEKYYFDSVWGEIDNIYPIDEMDNTSTTINSVSDNVITDNVWYSLNGTKVDKPNKGVYINNGKKYIIK